ncbi:MAG: hypothetical protein Q9168_007442 [Polycauliona sp. 1 TL-2023]
MAPHAPKDVSVIYIIYENTLPTSLSKPEGHFWNGNIMPRPIHITVTAISTTFPSTFTGEVYATTDGTPNLDQSFQLRGNGNAVKAASSGVDCIESTFQIVQGSGTGKFEGISGGGKLRFEYDDPQHKGRAFPLYGYGVGTCAFEGMNGVGATLM